MVGRIGICLERAEERDHISQVTSSSHRERECCTDSHIQHTTSIHTISTYTHLYVLLFEHTLTYRQGAYADVAAFPRHLSTGRIREGEWVIDGTQTHADANAVTFNLLFNFLSSLIAL